MSESRNEGMSIADKIERDGAEVADAEAHKAWLEFHNLAQQKSLVYDKAFERTGPKHKEEWRYKLTTKDGSYEGYARTKMGAKNLAARRALVAMNVNRRVSE